MRQFAGAVLAVAVLSATVHAQSQMVRVTVPKANVRSEPSDKAPILQQATPRDQIEWRATDGDWFKVLLPPNPALGGARVEAYISKRVSKLETIAAPARAAASSAGGGLAATPVSKAGEPAAPAVPVPPAVPAIDTHAANVFLGSIVDGTLLKQTRVAMAPNGNRQAWTIQNDGDWKIAADRRPALVVSIGDRAGFSVDGLAPAVVKLSAPPSGVAGLVIGSTKDAKDWKADEIALEMTEGPAGVWNMKPTRDLRPGDYAIIMRPLKSKAGAPDIAWGFSVK